MRTTKNYKNMFKVFHEKAFNSDDVKIISHTLLYFEGNTKNIF